MKQAAVMRWAFVLLLVLLCAWGAAGCRTEQADLNQPAGRPRVVLALNWFPEAEHGGFYAAQVHGYFDEEGLDVEILPGGPGAPVIQQVATDRVAFAVANADQVLLGREQARAVVAVMAAMQDSPRCIMVHANSGIDSLLKLRNLTLAVGAGKPFAKYLLSRLPDANLTVVPYQGNVAAFLQQENYAQQGYVFSEPFVARQQGADPQCLMLSEIGFNPYTSLLITSERMIKADPQLVAKVVRASLRGWEKYLEAPDETNQHIHAINSEMGLEILAYGAQAIRPLCRPDTGDAVPLGSMSPQRWQSLAGQLISVGLLEDDAQWQSAFDLQFLQ